MDDLLALNKQLNEVDQPVISTAESNLKEAIRQHCHLQMFHLEGDPQRVIDDDVEFAHDIPTWSFVWRSAVDNRWRMALFQTESRN